MNVQTSSAEPTPQEEGIRQAFVSRAVYGLVTVLAVLQAMELHPPSAWHGAATLFGTTLAVALLEAYSVAIAEMLARERGLSRDEFRAIRRDVGPVIVSAQGPTILLLIAAIGLISVERAIDLAQLVAFLFLFGYGWRIGKLLHERWLLQIMSGLLLVAIGGIIVGIKAAFH